MPDIPAAKVGEPFHLAPGVSGALGSVTWTVVAGTLPAGLSLDLFSGDIAGTPTTWGTTTAVVQAKDSDRWGLSRVVSDTVTVTVVPDVIRILTSALPAGVLRSLYDAALSATGGTGSYTWSVTGDLPQGISADPSGSLTGEPQRVGLFTLIIQVRDAKWPGFTTEPQPVSLEIFPPEFRVSVPAAPPGVIGSPYSLSATASGQAGTVDWSIAGQPAGLTVDAAGTVSGIPTAYGRFSAVVRARDSYLAHRPTGEVTETRTAEAPVTFVIAPLPIAITTATLPLGNVPRPYRAVLEFTGGTGHTTWSLVEGQLPKGLELSPDGIISGKPKAVGTFSFTVQASDVGWDGNVARRSFSLTIRAREVVLYAPDANMVKGTWSLVPDATAADGSRMWNPNKSAQKIDKPLANPANYFEIPFQAEAGVAYHLWLRGKADRNKRVNDAVMVQFSGSVDKAGTPKYRIGTTSATDVNLADCSGCHLSGWGWQDNGWGVNVMGPNIYFEQSGAQTIRVQVKQDGFSIDQIVLSAEKFLTVAPGALKNDRTLVLRDGSQCTMRLGTEPDATSDAFDPSRFAQCP